MRGRNYALPEDMTDLVPDVLRHRLVLSYEALSEGLSPDALVGKIMAKIPAPPSRWNMKSSLHEPPHERGARAPRGRQRAAQTPSTCCGGWSGPSSAASTACCRATTAPCSAAPGLDLADLREYQHHDDVRHIDWNVTARLQAPHVREFTEDREMAAWFLLDLSPSVDFGSGEQRKRNVSAEFVAVLARLLTRHGNRVGAVLYGSGVDTVIPTRGGRRHVLHLLHSMQARPAPAESRHDRPARPARIGRPA